MRRLLFLAVLTASLAGFVKPEVTQRKLSTYILFNGNCREAMSFYKEALGGTLTQTTVGESPMKAIFPKAMQGKIVNAKLVGPNIEISASDWLRPSESAVQGNTVCLYLQGGKPEELRAVFKRLSAGGTVTDPMKLQTFGLYGSLTDRFGVRWMFQTDQKE